MMLYMVNLKAASQDALHDAFTGPMTASQRAFREWITALHHAFTDCISA